MRRRFVQLPPPASPLEVVEALRSKDLRLGARKLSMDIVNELPSLPQVLQGVLGRACVVSHLPPGMTGTNVVAHFKTYRLAREGPGWSRPVTMLQFPPRKGEDGPLPWPAALVRFETPLDAMAAARDLHRMLLGEAAIEVRHVQ